MSPTLTANKSSSSAHDNPTGSRKASGKSGSGRGTKPSVLSRIFRVLLPCIGPSSAHPVELDVQPTRSSPEPSPVLKQESQAAALPLETEKSPAAPVSAPSPNLQAEPEKKVEDNESVAERELQSPPEEEVKIVQEPALLPEAETEGLTSGAVQPPGSTGVPPSPEKPASSQDGHESDRTDYTEDEDLDDVHLDEDEEEDKLILNGGAGIPIGPVRLSDNWRIHPYAK